MFNLNFSASTPDDGAPLPVAKENDLQQLKPAKRTRRRRNQQRPKMTQIEPFAATTPNNKTNNKKHHDAPMTKSDLYFALDCEMVGVGENGIDSAVARVTIVNWENHVVLDTFVQVAVPVTDYRTFVSGVSPQHLLTARTFDQVREQVETILRGKILIGHGLENDLRALRLTHPWCDTRDTALYAPYMQMVSGMTRPRKLRDLCWERLGRCIQLEGLPHSPMEDAIAALDLYKAARKEWEDYLVQQQMDSNRKSTFSTQRPYDLYPQQIPGIGYAFPYQQEQPARQHQNSSNGWFWSRRPKSPSGRDSVTLPEEPIEPVAGDNLEYSQQADTVSSPRSWSFFQRRSRPSFAIPSSLTTDTEESSGSSFSPDYTYLQETGWSQSFHIQGQGERARLGSEDVHWSQQQRNDDTWNSRQRSPTEDSWPRPRSSTEESWNEWREESLSSAPIAYFPTQTWSGPTYSS